MTWHAFKLKTYARLESRKCVSYVIEMFADCPHVHVQQFLVIVIMLIAKFNMADCKGLMHSTIQLITSISEMDVFMKEQMFPRTRFSWSC